MPRRSPNTPNPSRLAQLFACFALCFVGALHLFSPPRPIAPNQPDSPVSPLQPPSPRPSPPIQLRAYPPALAPTSPRSLPTPSPPSTHLEQPLIDPSPLPFLYQSSLRANPSLANFFPASEAHRSIAHRPLCRGEFAPVCHAWNYSVNSLHLWREAQTRKRALNRPHPLCPRSEHDYVSIASFIDSWNGQNRDIDCPNVKCRLQASITPSTTMYLEHNIISRPLKADPPVLNGIFCLEPEANFARPFTRSRYTYGGLDAQIVLNFDRLSDAPITYAAGFEWTGCSLNSPNPFSCLPPVPTVEQLAGKKLATAFISNCGHPDQNLINPHDWQDRFKASGWSTGHGRRRFLERMQSHLHLFNKSADSYAKCLHSPGLDFVSNVGGTDRYLAQVDIIKHYKFHFAFENLIIPDYNSEKQWVGVLAGAVPVVFGADVTFAPGGRDSYISALDFDSPESLVEYLLDLDAHPEKLLKYYAWRSRPVSPLFIENFNLHKLIQGPKSWPCRLCQRYIREFC